MLCIYFYIFIPGKPAALFDDTNPDWAPSVDLGYESKENQQPGKLSARYQRANNRHNKPLRLCVTDNHLTELINNSQQEDDVQMLDSQEEHEICVQINHLRFQDNFVQTDSATSKEQCIQTDNATKEQCIQTECVPLQDKFAQTDMSGATIDREDQMKREMELEILSLKDRVSRLQNNLLVSEEVCEKLFRDLEAKEKELSDYISALLKDNQARVKEADMLKSKLADLVMNEDNMKGQDNKVKFYTGLTTFSLLLHVFNLVSQKVNLQSSKCSLSKFQEFLIVMMRLRLGLAEQDLGYRFGVHQSTVSRIIDRWLAPMSHALERLIVWPERDVLQKTMPLSFQETWGRK